MKDVCFIFIPKLWDMIQCDLHMYLFKFRLKQRIGQTHLVASTWPKIIKTCRNVHEKTTFMVNSGWIFLCFFSGSYIMTHEYWRFSIASKVGYHMLVHLVQLKWWAQRLYMQGRGWWIFEKKKLPIVRFFLLEVRPLLRAY